MRVWEEGRNTRGKGTTGWEEIREEKGVMGTKATKGTGGAVTVFVTHSNAVFYIINHVIFPIVPIHVLWLTSPSFYS